MNVNITQFLPQGVSSFSCTTIKPNLLLLIASADAEPLPPVSLMMDIQIGTILNVGGSEMYLYRNGYFVQVYVDELGRFLQVKNVEPIAPLRDYDRVSLNKSCSREKWCDGFKAGAMGFPVNGDNVFNTGHSFGKHYHESGIDEKQEHALIETALKDIRL